MIVRTDYLTKMQQELFENRDRVELLSKREALLGSSWFDKIGSQFDETYMQSISQYLAKRRKEVMVYPAPENVFRAYQLTPFEEVKVVIILQDPYNDGTATGVPMGVKEPRIYPKSVDVLDIAIAEDLYDGFRLQPIDPDLEYLCAQGVLMLNSALTVEHKAPNSHQTIGWGKFIKATIEALNTKHSLIYLLLGSKAQNFRRYIADAHTVIEVEHPIKHKYENRPRWEHDRIFSKTNQLLINYGEEPINW